MNIKEQLIEFDVGETIDAPFEPSGADARHSDVVISFRQRQGKKPLADSENDKAEFVHREEEIAENNEQATVVTLPKEWIKVKRKPLYDFVKRAFDLIVALLCLTVGLPVYLLIALAVVIDDPGNPFFVQERVGLNGRVFRMVKFRTMYRDADKHKCELKNECASDVHFKVKNDPRITRVGKFLRATSLDETTQAINVLLNSMSVVGPRAFVIDEQRRLPDDRLQVKPGLTCYWQITDTTKMSYEDQLELDYKYIRERGVWTDLKLIWETIKLIFKTGNC